MLVQAVGYAQARSQIFVIGAENGVAEPPVAHEGNRRGQRKRRISLIWITAARAHPGRVYRIVPGEIDQTEVIVLFVIAWLDFISDPIIHGQPRRDLPLVLEVK